MPNNFLFGFGVIKNSEDIKASLEIDAESIYGPTNFEGYDISIYPSIDLSDKYFIGIVLNMVSDSYMDDKFVEDTVDLTIKILEISRSSCSKILKEKFGDLKWIMFQVYDA